MSHDTFSSDSSHHLDPWEVFASVTLCRCTVQQLTVPVLVPHCPERVVPGAGGKAGSREGGQGKECQESRGEGKEGVAGAWAWMTGSRRRFVHVSVDITFEHI